MTNKRKALLIIFISLFVLTNVRSIFPVEVKKIDIRRFEDFQEGELKGTSLDSKGRVFIGPVIAPIAGPASEYYLSLEIAPTGDLYVGTGHKASVYRVKPASPVTNAGGENKNPAEEIFTADTLDVYALLARANGDLFVGTSPEGKIYKITSPTSKERTQKEFFNPEDKFIWDLKEDKEGNIICATGNSGSIYRITPDGQGIKIFTAEDTHIISLYVTAGGSILAGSGDRGILYRIDNRKTKVLFDAPFEEIRGICEDKNGNIYFSATRGITKPEVTQSTSEPGVVKPKKDEKPEKTTERSVLYCLHTDGVAEVLWKTDTEYIYSILYDEKSDSILMGTGSSGRLYRVKKDGTYSIVSEGDSAQVYKIVSKGKNLYFITDNSPSIASIESAMSSKGNYYSDIFDLQGQARVGRIYWEAENTPQTEFSLYIRSGNSRIPDNTWSAWSAPYTDSENSSANISDCRYFQIKAQFNSKNGIDTPYLSSFKIYYLQSNLTPQVKRVEVIKPATLVTTTPASDKYRPIPPASVNKPSKYQIIAWQAEDPNMDKLRYTISIKKTNSSNWTTIKEDVTESEMDLDMELYQDGQYVVKIEADDSLSNPPGQVKAGVLISKPFLIDSTAPVTSNFSALGNHIKFTVQDQTSIISSVYYSYDGKLWFPVFPVDMIHDSKSETYDVELKNPGAKKIIFIKTLDEFNNCSVFQAEL